MHPPLSTSALRAAVPAAYREGMPDEEVGDGRRWPTHCPECGAPLQRATLDFDPTNENRAELNPGEMAEVDFCPNPDCPAKQHARPPGG